MAKGGLTKYLGLVLSSLEGVEPSVKAPIAAFHALENPILCRQHLWHSEDLLRVPHPCLQK
jgi:hypothetical protein